MTDCTVEIGSIDRPTRFQVNPVGNNNNNSGAAIIEPNQQQQITQEFYRRIPENDIEANEYDTFPEDGSTKIISRRPSRYLCFYNILYILLYKFIRKVFK